LIESLPPKRLRWRELPVEARETLEGKLRGLYGASGDEEAFDNLGIDKQQALLFLAHRLGELGLWGAIRRIENVYGTGGVGMNFSAWPELASALRSRRDFTTRFARHKDNDGGFLERERVLASLHFLYVDGDERRWAAHFDLYNPWSSPMNALRHLFYEKLKGFTPDWRNVRGVFLGTARRRV
jgi:hypothetical protein